ncbi:MAG: flagellar protein FlbT [Geobacter sp.]|nr:MAG: flagellar protein FlbT [Geobacter sp.]
MSLKLRLKPEEKVLVGKAVIKNGPRTSEFVVENNVPILRQKDILTEDEANSPSRRVYFMIQLMYIDSEKLVEYHKRYWELASDILAAAPSTKPYIEKISEQILACDYYQALKLTRKLMNYEEELLAHVKSI